MFYISKFGESLVFPPGIFIVVFFVLSLFMLHHQRVVGILGIVISLLLYACSTTLVADALIRQLEDAYSPPSTLSGDVLVMLGGGATYGTPDMGGTGNLTGDGANRLITTAMLYYKTYLPILLTSGPMTSDTSQSLIAKHQLIKLGVPAADIITEDNSLNTEQNAQFSAPILKEKGFHQPILITSAYHMRRAVLDFQQAGIHVIPYPSGYLANQNSGLHYDTLFPSAGALETTQTALHEYLGILAATFHLRG